MPCTSSGNFIGCTLAVRLGGGMRRDGDGARARSLPAAVRAQDLVPAVPVAEDAFAPFAAGA